MPIDADSFNAFEAAGWEQKGGGLRPFLRADNQPVIDPLLDAAAVGPGSARWTWPRALGTWPLAPPSAALT